MRGEVLQTKASSSQSLGSKGSDTHAGSSHIMVALKLQRLLFLVASAVPLIRTSRIEPCLRVSFKKGAKRARERKRGGLRRPARPGPGCPRAGGAGSRGHLRAAQPTGARSSRAQMARENASVFQPFKGLNPMTFHRDQNILFPAVHFVNSHERRGAGQTLTCRFRCNLIFLCLLRE